MPKITFIDHDGTVHAVEAEVGSTVMETAMRNDIASIVAECGGSCTCSKAQGLCKKLSASTPNPPSNCGGICFRMSPR